MSKLDEIKKEYEPKKETTDNPVVDEIRQHLKEKKVDKPKVITSDDENAKFKQKDREGLVDKTLIKIGDKKIKLRRKEKKIIEDMEYDTTRNTSSIAIGLTIVGLAFLFIIKDFLPTEGYFVIIILIGSMMFLPVGMVIGWVTLDVYMRCKILRKLTRRNWGIVNFVGKGKRIVSKIKNFDYGLIWQEDNCWILTKDKIMQLTKDGNVANEGYTLDPDSILTLVDTIPVIFVDMDSMEPLTISTGDREPVYPSEIGSCCKAWIDIQRAKMLKGRKTIDMLMIVAIICSIGAIAVTVFTLNKVDELTKLVQTLYNQLIPPP